MDKCPECGSKEQHAVKGAFTDEGGDFKPVPLKPSIYVKHEDGGSARLAVCAKCGAGYPSDEKV